MAEYIDRKHLEEWLLNETASLDTDADKKCVVERIRHYIPAADVIERKRGMWQIVEKHTEYRTERCSICGFVANRTYIRDIWNFCPNCCADMRKDESEE